MRTYYVYMLLCADGTYYTGVTNNITRRFHQHKTGYIKGSYTSYQRPVNLVYFKPFNRILVAIAFEQQLKSWSQAKKQALIAGDFEKIALAAKRNLSKIKLYDCLFECLPEKLDPLSVRVPRFGAVYREQTVRTVLLKVTLTYRPLLQ